MDCVVLDANAVGVDPPLTKIEHRLLFDAHRAGSIGLVVPELAVLEAVNTWKGLIKRQADKLRNVRQELQKLVPSYAWTPAEIDRDRLAERLHVDILKTLESATVAVPKTPDVSHDDLIARALSRRQPFDNAGSGYRDALLWEIVRGYEAQGHNVALVSNDPAAYAEERKLGKSLAQTLNEELSGRGRVSLFATLSEAIESLGLVQAEALESTHAIVERLGKSFPELLLAEVKEDLSHPVHRWVTRDVVNPFAGPDATLGTAYGAVGAEVDEARRMEDGRLEASVVLEVRQSATIIVPAGVTRVLDRVGRPYAVDENFDALDIDLIVKHRCRVVLDPMTGRIDSAEGLETIHARLSNEASRFAPSHRIGQE
jgi:hypothetical protein